MGQFGIEPSAISALPVDTLRLEALAPGTRQAFLLKVVVLEDGVTLRVPVDIIIGVRTGPTIAAIAGIHGDEVEGVMALIELWEELGPEQIRGRLILIPVANPPAFGARRRTSPLDDLDLNRVFPGRPDGAPSERIAHSLCREVLQRTDFLFSMHSWYSSGSVIPYVEFSHLFPDTADRSFAAAVACGFEFIRVSHWSPGVMTRVANEAGVAGIEAEVGGTGTSRVDLRAGYKRYLMNLLRHLGMIEGDSALVSAPRVVSHFDVASPRSGILRPVVRLGEEIRKGSILATLHDLNGESLEVIEAPDHGLVAAIHEAGLAAAGALVFRLFQDAGELWRSAIRPSGIRARYEDVRDILPTKPDSTLLEPITPVSTDRFNQNSS